MKEADKKARASPVVMRTFEEVGTKKETKSENPERVDQDFNKQREKKRTTPSINY